MKSGSTLHSFIQNDRIRTPRSLLHFSLLPPNFLPNSIHCLRNKSFSLLCKSSSFVCILFQSHRFPLISSFTFLPFSPLANPLLFNYFESLHSKSKQALLFIFCSLSIFFSLFFLNIPNISNTFPNTLPLIPGTQRNVSPQTDGLLQGH